MTATSPFWCTESLIVTVNGPEGRSTVTINKPFARIGRHSRSEVVLRGEGMDPRCLYLHATPEGVFCVPLLPTQQGRLGSGRWLKDDEVVPVGPYEISARLQRGTTGSTPRVALTAWGSGAPPLPVCEISIGGKIRDKRRFRARLNFVGRRRELALQLQGLQVSSCHCALYWDVGKLWCIDLLSSNGTLLNDQPIDCGLLEFGQALQIGEFSVLLKRLSRSSERPSAWRTGESDEEVVADDAEQSEADPAAASPAQSTSVASGDTGESPPNPTRAPLVPSPNTVIAQASQQLVHAGENLRRDQSRRPEELTQRSQQLIAQRQQLDQQWSEATQDVATQVSHLQTESALLAAQRQEVIRLRAAWEEQHRILTEDLKNLKEEISQRETHLDEQRRFAPLEQVPAIVPLSEAGERVAADPDSLPAAPLLAGPNSPSLERADPLEPRSPLFATAPGRTVIEGSYVVEKETSLADLSKRLAHLPVHSPQTALPLGRHRAADLQQAAPVASGTMATSTVQSPVAPDFADPETQGLTVSTSAPHSAAIRPGLPAPRLVAGRRKQADDDRMGEFVTERMIRREGERRIWLKVLWGAAAAISLVALATLGYIVLSAR